MGLSRIYEEPEVAPELRRIYGDIRTSFDLPYVPTLFKLLAGVPDYLNLSWDDLGPTVRSREFQSAAKALEEFARSLVISAGWRFPDQQRLLVAQKFSSNDIEQLGGIVATFARAAAKIALFSRLLQKGYSGGQPGRVSTGRQASALARMLTLHVPAENEAGLRVWLIYSDIRRTLGCRNVLSMFRVLSPFPAYLAAVWLDSKRIIADPAFIRSREDCAKRSLALLTGMPVKNHRAGGKQIDAQQWRTIEESVDALVRMAPQLVLLTATWQRSLAAENRIAALA